VLRIIFQYEREDVSRGWKMMRCSVILILHKKFYGDIIKISFREEKISKTSDRNNTKPLVKDRNYTEF
jgi:hypothetical protein